MVLGGILHTVEIVTSVSGASYEYLIVGTQLYHLRIATNLGALINVEH